MIAKLKGLVDSTGDDWLVLDVGGVGYLLFCSSRTLGRLPAAGEATRLLVETHVREEYIHLYGFFDAAERDWFRLLTTVQGVGSKVALAILSAFAVDDLARAIAAADKVSLTRASGVGPKLAVRLVTELKDKAAVLSLGGGGIPAAAVLPAGAAPLASGPLEDAISALVNLGYRRLEAHGAVLRAAELLGEGAALNALIGAALKLLGQELGR